MLNLFRARNNSSFILVFGIHRTTVHLVIVDVGKDGTPSLVVSDEQTVAGDDVAVAIQQLNHKYQKFSKHNPQVALVLGSGLYQSVTLDKPQLSEEELVGSLRYQLSDLVTFEPDDCVADYYELPLQVQGQNKIHAVACSRKFIEPLLQAAHDISERVVGVFAEEQALMPLLAATSDASAFVFQHPKQAALVQVYNSGDLQVTRAVRSLEKLSELSMDEIKMGGLQPLSVEVQRSADYFERQLRQRPLTHLHLALPLKKQHEVLEKLYEDLGLQVDWAQYPEWAQELAAGDYSDFPALGGALVVLQQAMNEAEA